MTQGSVNDQAVAITRIRGLVLASHPLPSIVVTVLALVLGLAVGLGPLDLSLVTAMVFIGQLSVGWSNDWIDATRDTTVDRQDKPIVTGRVRRSTIGLAALAAVIVTLVLGFWVAPTVGVANVLCVASAWTYNAALKSTRWSWVPFAVSFGMLSLLVTLALPGSPWPKWWVLLAGALLGVAAHFANVLPDLADDRRTGVSGLPHRLGARASGTIPFVLLALVSALLGLERLGESHTGTALSVMHSPAIAVGVLLGLAIAVSGIVLARMRRPTRALMRLIMLGALVNVATLFATGASLVAAG